MSMYFRGKPRRKFETESGTKNGNRENSSSVYMSNLRQEKSGPCLFLIDPQNDFIEDDGSLKVAGAKEDSLRTADFIRTNIDLLQEIYVTLDTHMQYHIAHPMFWRNANNEQPNPFTLISHQDIKNRVWMPKDSSMEQWVLHYTKQLETQPRLKGLEAFKLIIWPEHCLIGTKGHNVEKNIAEALLEWEQRANKTVHYVMKGNNSKTEHYSAFRAEVVVEEDPDTQFNISLAKDLMAHSQIYVAGQAKSHCVNFSVRDLVSYMRDEMAIQKIVLMDGCMSSVTGFETQGEKFMEDMKNLNPNANFKVGYQVRKGRPRKMSRQEVAAIRAPKRKELERKPTKPNFRAQAKGIKVIDLTKDMFKATANPLRVSRAITEPPRNE